MFKKHIFLLLISFNVSAFTITPSMTGSWFDGNNSGQGINVEVLSGNRFLLYWYAYDQGEPLWLTGVGTYSGDTATIETLETFRGSNFGVNHDQSLVERSTFGSLTVTFSYCNNGTMTYNSVSGLGSGTINLNRLTEIPDLPCANPPAYNQRVITRNGIRVTPGECNLFGTSLTCDFKVTSLDNDIELILEPVGGGDTILTINDENGTSRFNGSRYTLGSVIDRTIAARQMISQGQTIRGAVTFSNTNIPRTLQGADTLNLDFRITGRESFNLEWLDIAIINHNL